MNIEKEGNEDDEEEILRLNAVLSIQYADKHPTEQFSKLEVAIACYENAHIIRKDKSNMSALFMAAITYYDMAFRHDNENNTEMANSSIDKCLEKCLSIINDDNVGIIYKGRAALLAAKAYRFIGKYDEAKGKLEYAKEVFKPEDEFYAHVLKFEEELNGLLEDNNENNK